MRIKPSVNLQSLTLGSMMLASSAGLIAQEWSPVRRPVTADYAHGSTTATIEEASFDDSVDEPSWTPLARRPARRPVPASPRTVARFEAKPAAEPVVPTSAVLPVSTELKLQREATTARKPAVAVSPSVVEANLTLEPTLQDVMDQTFADEAFPEWTPLTGQPVADAVRTAARAERRRAAEPVVPVSREMQLQSEATNARKPGVSVWPRVAEANLTLEPTLEDLKENRFALETPPSATSLQTPLEAAVAGTTDSQKLVATTDADTYVPLPVHLMAQDQPGSENAGPMEDPSAEVGQLDTSLLPPIVGRPVSLIEARHIALQNNKQIAVLRNVQHERGAEIAVQEGRFDPFIGAELVGGESDRQNRSIIQSAGVLTNQQTEFYFRPTGLNQFYLEQRNKYGGKLTIGYTAEYDFFTPSDESIFVNPSWFSRSRVTYEQSLLRNRRYDVNVAPIVIAQRLTQQAQHLFQAEVHKILQDVEVAYWDLRQAHELEEVIAQFETKSAEMLEIEKGRLDAGRGTVLAVSQAEERNARAQILLTRATVATAVAGLKLKRLAGMPAWNIETWYPIDPLTIQRPVEDLGVALARGTSRPEVLAQNALLNAQQFQVHVNRDQLKGDLRVIGDYSITGLEERLDDAISTQGDFDFYEWNVGIQYRRALYRRSEKAALRQSELAYCRTAMGLDQIRHMISHEIASAHETLMAAQAELALLRKRTEAGERDLAARRELYDNGRASLDSLLEADDRLVAARTDEQLSLANYQRAITRYNFASGAILCQDVIIE